MIVKFTPNPYSNFQFQATFDGTNYTVIVTWNIYGQRYYVNVYTLNNRRVFSLPIIGSPKDANISMTAGYFSTQFIYRESMQQFEII